MKLQLLLTDLLQHSTKRLERYFTQCSSGSIVTDLSEDQPWRLRKMIDRGDVRRKSPRSESRHMLIWLWEDYWTIAGFEKGLSPL